MTDKKLKWRHLKALNQIYEQGFTKAVIKKHSYIDYLVRNEIIKPKIGKSGVLEQGFGFKEEYEKEHLVNFRYYQKFLTENNVLLDQSNYSETDIRTLMFIKEHKDEILTQQYSRKKFSALFFKEEGAKHLDENEGLETAVLKILGLEKFPGKDPKDQQYKFVIDCPDPKLIVLCENIDFLLLPWVARENNIELWYAGGNNIEKLDHLPSINLPIFYSCDWDYDGLRIYERIKNKIPQINLLYPSTVNDSKSVRSGSHKSDWKYDKPFSGLSAPLYTEQAIGLINGLIKKKQWIEEESNDLRKMVSKEVYL
jgi:hypothetical protein